MFDVMTLLSVVYTRKIDMQQAYYQATALTVIALRP